MGIVDLILNLAGLLLWLNWRSIRFDPLAKRTPATLMGTLRPATPKKLRPWHLLIFIIGLLFLRAVIYRWITPLWVGKLDLGIIMPPFRSDQFWRIFTFSFCSFGLALGIFNIGLLFLSLLRGPEPISRLVKIPLGRVDDWPRWVKIILPFVATAFCWWAASWLFASLQIIPQPVSVWRRIEESLIIGLGSYLIWKFPASAILMLHLLSSYIYFGKHPFWNYIHVTAQTILQPLRKIPLRIGKVDFAPVLAIAIIFLAAESVSYGLYQLYTRLPF